MADVPRSSKNEILGSEEHDCKIKLTSAPVAGRANRALKELLARRLGLPKGNIDIITGERSKVKSVQITGLSLKDVKRLLEKKG